MGDFANDTAVDGRDRRYQARLSRDWEIWGPNGGYVAAIALRAAGAATPLRRPATFSGHFLNVAAFDVVDLQVATLRASKRTASLRVSMTQQSRPIMEAIVWVVAESDGLQHHTLAMPDVPPPAALKSIEELVPPEERKNVFRFWDNLDARPLDFVPWRERVPGSPVWREWCRFRPRATFDDPFVDAARSLLLIDTMLWPAGCRAHPPDQPYMAPSLDVTAQFHQAAPESDWLLVDAVAPVAADGLVGGQSRVWSADGRLRASGTGQLICRPAPTGNS